MPKPWEWEMVSKNGVPVLRDLVKNPNPSFSCLYGVMIERELPAKNVSRSFSCSASTARGFPCIPCNGFHISQRDGGIHCSDVYQAPGLQPVHPRVPVDWGGVVEVEDELSIRCFS